MNGRAIVLRGDARNLPLQDASVDLICTSPPYWSLRDYRDGDASLEGQIGAESTPGEYLESLWECTREWMRVLKPEGSIFVVLGDTYSSGQRLDDEFTIEDAAWLAGVIDSDGSISIHLNKQPEGRAPSFVPWTRVAQLQPDVVQRIGRVTGTGQVYKDSRGMWNWNASAQQARRVLERIWPWLHIKRRQAFAAIELARHIADRKRKGSWAPLTAEDISYRQQIRDAVLAWNAGSQVEWEPPLAPMPNLPSTPRRVPQKSLMMLPERYAIGCIDRLGLILRAEIVWAKPSAMPESVTDRVRRSHEVIFHLTKQPRYFAAVDEIRSPASDYERKPGARRPTPPGQRRRAMADTVNPLGSLPGSVWEIASQPLLVPEHLATDHFAAFPFEIPRRIIRGWSPPGICTACGEGRRPIADVQKTHAPRPGKVTALTQAHGPDGREGSRPSSIVRITGYACACPSPDAPSRPAVVVDPFGGTGTTALVAATLGRRGVSVDRSAGYCRLAQWRTTDPAERARALGLPKPPPVDPGQERLFEEIA